MRIKYKFRSRGEAEIHLHARGWKWISSTGHYLNDNLPGQTRLIVRVVPGDWRIQP